MQLQSFTSGFAAVVIGAGGGIGQAVAQALDRDPAVARLAAFNRGSDPPVDLLDETTIARAADTVRALEVPPRLIFDATGILHGEGLSPEKSWRHLDAASMAHAFAVNATGPALLIKHFMPLLPRDGKAVFATLSARVGSIGDNGYGGWYAYRASKAALNQIVRTAAVELGRRRPEAACVALHPGTVATPLTEPFHKSGLTVRQPGEAAGKLLAVVDGLTAEHSGGFYDYDFRPIPW
jgi:NAD(P)-dependent dehydrogenase (short-subunit alcohol dehydrogenase family)